MGNSGFDMPSAEKCANEEVRNRLIARNLRSTVKVILWFVSLITVVAKFVPFSPGMPRGGLDPSWQFGINEATARGLSFGKEIIFTFGPYACLYTKAYHPLTDFMMLSGSLYLAFSYWACFVVLMKGVQWRWVLAFCFIIAGLMYSRDALFFSLPMLVGLVTLKIFLSAEGLLAKRKLAPFYLILLFAPLGLLPLVKGTMLMLCSAVAVLCSAIFFINRHGTSGIVCLFTPIASVLFFWVASGQSAASLPTYFISMGSIASGYTEAMAVGGDLHEIVVYLATWGLLLVAISVQREITNTSKIALFCIYFIFLFLSFKAGFVRHDGHAVIAGASILIAAMLLPFIFTHRIVVVVITLSLISWYYIDSHYVKTSMRGIAGIIVSTYSSSWDGFKKRILDGNWLRREFDAAVNSLGEEASFPVLPGSTDIYSCSQAYLISSGNMWSPRPIFQSYSVYTPALSEENTRHLLGDQAPDNIIFRVEPIDERVPSIEDGASWPILIANYEPTVVANDFLFLRKRQETGKVKERVESVSETHAFGENVKLARASKPIFAQIDIAPTAWGRIANFLFKPSQLQITIELNNGMKKQYRIISGMAKSGFLISPLVENTTEFGLLYGKQGYLDGKIVKSFTIAESHGKTRLWSSEYTVRLSQVRMTTSPVDVSEIFEFDGSDDELSGSKAGYTETCEGNIDEVNGTSPALAPLSVEGFLRVRGWLALSIDEAALPEAIFVVLTDEHGNHLYFRTRRASRVDVGAYFRKPGLNESGFSAVADVSTLEGRYTLGLAVEESNEIKICRQFEMPLTINK